MDKKSALASNLLVFRKKKNLSIMDLVRLTGLTRQSLYDYEDGKYLPSEESMEKLAKVLDVSVSELRYGEPTKKATLQVIPHQETKLETLYKELAEARKENIDLMKQLIECQKLKTI